MNLQKYIEENTLRCEVSYRGGGIEVDASDYTKIDGAKISAYQNYLGGGIAGAIQSSRNFETKNKVKQEKADRLANALKKYFYALNNGGGDEYMQEINTYTKNQHLPGSAF